MAKLNNQFGFIGTLGGMTAYSRRDMEGKVILRTKGGANKKKIKTAASFATTRKLNTEWKAVTAASGLIRKATYRTNVLSDYLFTGTLNGLFKKMQLLDTDHVAGQRAVYVSQYAYMIDGFSFTKQKNWDSVVVAPVQCTINRAEGSAVVVLPELMPGSSFRCPWQLPFYRLIVQAGLITDVVYDEAKQQYEPVVTLGAEIWGAVHVTDWLPCTTKRNTEEIVLNVTKGMPLTEGVIMVVSAGIEFGSPAASGEIEYKKYTGLGKVLRVG